MTIESLFYKITDSDLTVSVTYVDETGEHIQNIEAVVVDNVVDFSATDKKIQEFFMALQKKILRPRLHLPKNKKGAYSAPSPSGTSTGSG